MKTLMIAVLLAFGLGARMAEAEGFNIAWDKCQAAGGTSEKVFDCADISALDNIVVSFRPATDLPGFVGLEAVLGVTGTGPLPDYWQLAGDGCNGASWSVALTPPPGSAAACLALWPAAAGALTQYETPVSGDPSRARIHVWISRSPVGLLAANEYFGFRVQLSRENAPFCFGCDATVYVNVQSVRLLDRVCPAPLRSDTLTTPVVVDQIAANGSLVGVEPAEVTLSLAGTLQNPVLGTEAIVRFSLPDASPAWLELLDVMGRRVVRREVGTLGAGPHQVRLSEGTSIPPGVYHLRLSNTRATQVRKTVIVQ